MKKFLDVERLVYISSVMPCGGEGQTLNGPLTEAAFMKLCDLNFLPLTQTFILCVSLYGCYFQNSVFQNIYSWQKLTSANFSYSL